MGRAAMTVIRPSDENHWITGPLMLEVFFTAEDGMPPLICGIDGRVHAGSINDIESSLVEEVTDGDLFSDGAGSYYLQGSRHGSAAPRAGMAHPAVDQSRAAARDHDGERHVPPLASRD
jgi:hypothetical protein